MGIAHGRPREAPKGSALIWASSHMLSYGLISGTNICLHQERKEQVCSLSVGASLQGVQVEKDRPGVRQAWVSTPASLS